MFIVNQDKANEIDLKKLKEEGETYALNEVDYKVPFKKDDADAMLQVNTGFAMGLTSTKLHFSNGTIMPISNVDFEDFALWFMHKRNSFFV